MNKEYHMHTQPNTGATRRDLVAYFLLAYAISWAIAIPLAAAKQGWIDWQPPFAIHYLVAFGPMLSAILVTCATAGIESVKRLLQRIVRWPLQRRWWLVALSPLLAYAVIAVLLRLAQGEWTDVSLLGEVNFLPPLGAGALALWIFTFGLGEEVGWRGFALPRLQRNRSPLAASLVLWVFWAIWHWPMFFYIYDPALLPMILLGMLTGTIFLTWLYNGSRGSLLMVILWHATYDFITASKAGEGVVAAIVTALVMVWAVVLVVRSKAVNLPRRSDKNSKIGPISEFLTLPPPPIEGHVGPH
jgi:membrane protease YdiL (CAAX protease family)